MNLIGLDIGTTTICAFVLDIESGNEVETVIIPNNSTINTGKTWENCQDPEKIVELVTGLLDQLKARHAPVGAIGLTGQMHGIVYLDSNGWAVSPLYTWQDQRGSLISDTGITYTEELTNKVGYFLADGYGSVIHYYNSRNHLIPANACCFASIQDYVSMVLANRKRPLVHVTSAASFGLFQLNTKEFDNAAISRACMNESFFPETTNEISVLGYSNDGIPIAVAIGDNQASFIGSVRDPENSILINIGTGGQISVRTPKLINLPSIETRPCFENDYLLVGSTLCGGCSYELLERFIRRCAELTGQKIDNLYPQINELAQKNLNINNNPRIQTSFAGTRQNPTLRGSINNLDKDNFTPEQFIVATLKGIADELYSLYSKIESALDRQMTTLIGSGNGIRLNPALREIIARFFNKQIYIPVQAEEASLGAALFASVAIKVNASLAEAQKVIQYR